MIVATLGLYSVVAYSVSWRTREIGVRMAIGATAGDVVRFIILGGAPLATLGIVAGVIIALVAGPSIQMQLFETSSTDPLVLGAVAVIVQCVALIACWLPARRAARIDPVEALKSE